VSGFLMTGPEHLAEAATWAAMAADEIDEHDTGKATAVAAVSQAHAAISQAFAFAAIAAADTTAPELAAQWLAVIDPTGEIKQAMAARDKAARQAQWGGPKNPR
jgi:hypothetical protein